jgi:TonB family protein
MQEAVSTIIAERGREGDGLRRTMALSIGAHVIAVTILVVMPADWRSRRADALPHDVLYISLGGTPGPRSGGMTPIDARPIQKVLPLPDPKRPEPIRPPASKAPEMTAPDPKARPLRSQAPTTGPQERTGTARAETGATRGTGFGGLTTGGGGGTGGYVEAGDFCCPDYLAQMVSMISQNWNQFQQVPGETLMKFTIRRDGRIITPEVERSSGFVALDLAAQRALAVTDQLPALPSAYPQPMLVVHLSFQYKR